MQSVFPLFTDMWVYALPGINFGGWIMTSVITGTGMFHTNYCKNNILSQPWKLTLKCNLIYVDA